MDEARARCFGFGMTERPLELAIPEEGKRAGFPVKQSAIPSPTIRADRRPNSGPEPGWREAGLSTGLRPGARAKRFGFGRTERPGLLDPFQDLLVLDLEFGIALGLFADHLPEGVVLT